MALAPFDPSGPAVAAAAVVVADGVPPPAPQRRGGIVEHGVDQLGVREGRHCAGDRPSVKAVDDGAQVDFPRGNRELRDVGDPKDVGGIGVEVAVDRVLGRIRYLALARAAPALPRAKGMQILLGHDAAHDLLGYGQALNPRHGVDASAPVAPAAFAEYLADADAEVGVLVGFGHCRHLVAVARLGKARHVEQVPELTRRPQALHQDRLLPVGGHPRIGASAFSQKLDRPLRHGALELELVDVGLDSAFIASSSPIAVPFFFPGIFDGATSPRGSRFQLQGGGALDAHAAGDRSGWPRSRREADDGVLPGGTRDAAMGSAHLPAVGLELVDPCRQKPLRGIARSPAGPGEAFAVLEVMVDGDAPGALAVMRVWVGIGNVVAIREALIILVAERPPARAAQLVNRPLRAEVVFDERLDRPQLLFPRVHAASKPLWLGSDFRQHPQMVIYF